MIFSYRSLFSICFTIFYSALVGCSATQNLGADQTSVNQCNKRFSNHLAAHEKSSTRIRLTQNFILTEILNDRVACAKNIANSTDSEAFGDYYVALALYFDLGNQDSYIRSFQALRRYSFDDGGCTIKVSDELGSYSHIDCGAIFLLTTFIVLETEHEVFLARSGIPPGQEHAQHLHSSGLQLTLTGLPGAFKKVRARHGPPKSLLIEEKYIPAYLKEMLHVYWALTFRIITVAEEANLGEFSIFGNSVGQARKDQAFWSNGELNEYSRELLETARAELVSHYYTEAELESGNFLGNDPASYCKARLFIFGLIFDGSIQHQKIVNSMPYKRCLEYHEAKWR